MFNLRIKFVHQIDDGDGHLTDDWLFVFINHDHMIVRSDGTIDCAW